MKRLKHNDLTHYFMTPHEQLPASYLASCEKFFQELKERNKLQASSLKPQASSLKPQATSSGSRRDPGFFSQENKI